MIKWIKIAFRNIVKNKRRSFVTLLAIAVGFAAVREVHVFSRRESKNNRLGARGR